MEKQFVAFKVGTTCYCIDIMAVSEVIREQYITNMPNFPDFVEGIINLRGTMIPILSIDKRLARWGYSVSLSNTNQQTLSKNNTLKLIIVHVNNMKIALIVDILDKILTVSETIIQSAEGLGDSFNHKIVSGIIHYNEVIYTVLNPSYMLDGSESELLTSNIN